MRNKKTVFAFGKIKDTVKYRLKYAHFPYLAKALLRERAALSQGLSILDVGCGPGNIAAFCGLPAGSKWFGIDLWDHQLRQAAEKNVYDSLLQVNLLHGLPFRDESMDVVICNEVLMYLPNSREVLAEFHRILRPRGKVFIYNPISWFPRLMARLKGWIRTIHQESNSIAFDRQTNWKNADRPSRITYYSFKELIEEITAADFETSHVTGFRLFRNRIRFMTRLENYRWYFRLTRFLAGRWPQLASDLMVAAARKEEAQGAPVSVRERVAA
jgi:ubiquinone/menaquinone biosynthesis C-methylase UbiE